MAQPAHNNDDNKQEEKGNGEVYQEQYIQSRNNYRFIWGQLKMAYSTLNNLNQQVQAQKKSIFRLTQQLSQASINKRKSDKIREVYKLKSLQTGDYAVEVYETPGGANDIAAYQEELNRTTREYLSIAQGTYEPPRTQFVRKIVQPVPHPPRPSVYDYAYVCVIL